MDGEEQDVVFVDDGIHTAACPYCGDLGCWCHTSITYHDEFTHPVATDVEIEQAYDFYGIAR